MPSYVINDSTLKITDVIPITVHAVRNYPAWVIVKIQTDQGVEGIGEGFTWAGQAGSIADYFSLIGQEIVGSAPRSIQSLMACFQPKSHDRIGVLQYLLLRLRSGIFWGRFWVCRCINCLEGGVRRYRFMLIMVFLVELAFGKSVLSVSWL